MKRCRKSGAKKELQKLHELGMFPQDVETLKKHYVKRKLESCLKIVIYTSNGCPKCMTLKRWLKDRGLKFEEKTLDTDVMTDLIMKNVFILSAPALEAEGTFYTEQQIFDENGLVDAKVLEFLKCK